ncbi:MAG: GFA family protein, partial [Rhizobium oryzihabitans]
MSQVSATEHGQCLCGAVGLEAVIGAREFGVCHCSMCRRWSGGA